TRWANVVNPTGSLSGHVFLDLNDNGVIDPGEDGIAGVTIALTGVTADEATVNLTTTTAADGIYGFAGLQAGVYTLIETQPTSVMDGRDAIGTQGGITLNDSFTEIHFASGVNGTGNNFGERPDGSPRFELDLAGYVYTDCNEDGIKEGN